LDPDTYFAIYDLKPGAISKPMLITMPDGKKAYRLIQLNSTSKPHKANLKEDFDKISNFAKESKKNEYFLNWLKTKRTETYIYTDPLCLRTAKQWRIINLERVKSAPRIKKVHNHLTFKMLYIFVWRIPGSNR
jgi:hypothetical protein